MFEPKLLGPIPGDAGFFFLFLLMFLKKFIERELGAVSDRNTSAPMKIIMVYGGVGGTPSHPLLQKSRATKRAAGRGVNKAVRNVLSDGCKE